MTTSGISGRITCTPAVVLSRSNWKETDRLAVLYTEKFGKLPVRFIGVNRPRGKLKALSEPMVWGEYRLHLRPHAEFATVLGGSLLSVFPGIRADFLATLRGLETCELLEQLTPNWQPSLEKYALILECLRSLERGHTTWVSIAFALRLMRSAGFGVGQMRVSEGNRALWDALHTVGFDALESLPEDPERQTRLEEFILKAVERLTERQLRAARLRRELAGDARVGI